MNPVREISIQPLSIIIHDGGEPAENPQDERKMQLYAGRFKFGTWQKDFFFQAPTGYAENWKKACDNVKSRSDYKSSIDFSESVYMAFKEMGFQPIAK